MNGVVNGVFVPMIKSRRLILTDIPDPSCKTGLVVGTESREKKVLIITSFLLICKNS
jgi:hypothetical protein